MSKGHIFLAQNSDVDYLRQAYALALSIKIHNKENQTCIITDHAIPDEYRSVFDYIKHIPWGDDAKHSQWKVENRWKIIHATPFDENFVYDTDMLLLNTNDHWWKYFETKDFFFTSNVLNYKGNLVTSDFYRKTFTANRLPNIYTGFFYFKKIKESYEFFKWLEIIVDNWKDFYKIHLKEFPQRFCSIDVSAALALKFLDKVSESTSNSLLPSFVHMKPVLQEWNNLPENWTDVLHINFNEECQLKIGNNQQSGLFHYVEDTFLQQDILEKLINHYDRKQ